MARTNFTFEKRRKELERKKKKEAKLQARLDKRAASAERLSTTADPAEGPAAAPEAETPESGAAPPVLPS